MVKKFLLRDSIFFSTTNSIMYVDLLPTFCNISGSAFWFIKDRVDCSFIIEKFVFFIFLVGTRKYKWTLLQTKLDNIFCCKRRSFFKNMMLSILHQGQSHHLNNKGTKDLLSIGILPLHHWLPPFFWMNLHYTKRRGVR